MPILAPPSSTETPGNDEVLDAFLSHCLDQGLELYPHQEEAVLELFGGANVILNTPTGSGKSLVAMALQYRAICQGSRCYYTVPIKALANEKFLSLCDTFGPEQVGMITGDATVNPGAPVICCTAEILANQALREGEDTEIADVVMDEFHYYSDPERGVAWQLPLLLLSQTRFLLMSATLGDTAFFEEELTRLNGLPTALVSSQDRPVPLEFAYSTDSLEEKVEELVEQDRAPIYLVHFTQLACARSAQNLMSRNFCSKEEKQVIAEVLREADFRSPYGKEMKRLLRHGLGIHHAGLLPKYRVLVEKLAQQGLLKVICGTDTLGVGVNVPIRTVLFTQLFKYGGKKTETLSVRDFQQISGRAGRRGFDTVGYVVAQAPEHVVANLKAEEKAQEKGKKKVVKKKPPEKGFVNWDESTFQRLIDSPPEKLTSSFQVNHGLLVNVIQRDDIDACQEIRELITRSHEAPVQKKRHRKRAFSLFRGLVEGGIVRILPMTDRSGPQKLKLDHELPEDFSLHHALSVYLLDTIPRLDVEDEQYGLQVLSLVEAILENPAAVLRKQVDKEKTAAMAAMKAEGVEYDERIERLDEIEHPQPGKEFIYDTYNEFVTRNPWAKEAGVRPKAIAREMVENWYSFEDYIKIYGLERGEAVLLRHLSEVYKILSQTIPDALKNDSVDEAEVFLETIVRNVDSSLIDEWEKRQGEEEAPTEEESEAHSPRTATVARQHLQKQIKVAVFEFLRAFSQGRIEEALLFCGDASTDREAELQERASEFRARHGSIRLDPEARNERNSWVAEEGGILSWEQRVLDTEGLDDWRLRCQVDLETMQNGEPLRLKDVYVGPEEETFA